MHSANLSILYTNKEKNWPNTGHLTSIPSECFWTLLFQKNWISWRIDKFCENLSSLNIFALNIKQLLWKYHILPTHFGTALVLLRSKKRKY